MLDTHWKRILWHAFAVAGAIVPWFVLEDFGARMLASGAIFFAVSVLADWRFGPMASADEVRQSVMDQLARK